DRSHRYAVRARVKDGDRVLFASTDTVLVVTQGHDNSADLTLTKIQSAVAPAAPKASTDRVAKTSVPGSTSTPAAAPAPVALTGLPATFSGMMACADCGSGARYQLTLFPDDSFVSKTMRTSRGSVPVDDLGSWVLSSDRRVLVLKGAGAQPEFFSIKD